MASFSPFGVRISMPNSHFPGVVPQKCSRNGSITTMSTTPTMMLSTFSMAYKPPMLSRSPHCDTRLHRRLYSAKSNFRAKYRRHGQGAESVCISGASAKNILIGIPPLHSLSCFQYSRTGTQKILLFCTSSAPSYCKSRQKPRQKDSTAVDCRKNEVFRQAI